MNKLHWAQKRWKLEPTTTIKDYLLERAFKEQPILKICGMVLYLSN